MGKSSKKSELRQRNVASDEASEEEEKIVTIDGKTYKERKPLPDVGYLIQFGIPGQEGKKDPNRKWYEDYILPGILFLVFILSLIVFHNVQSRLPPRKPFTLPKMPTDAGPKVNTMAGPQ